MSLQRLEALADARGGFHNLAADDLIPLLREYEERLAKLETQNRALATVYHCDAKCWQEGECTGACGRSF